jgi:hypothetical protein
MVANGVNRYLRIISGEHPPTGKRLAVEVDVYAIADAYGLKAARAHALKKLLLAGERGPKSKVQDLLECIQAIERAIEMEGE